MAQLQTIGIVSTPGVLGGKPHIEGHRISVQQVAELHEHLGQSVEEIADAYGLTLGEVYAALSYYHTHREEVDRSIRTDRDTLDRIVGEGGSLDELRLLMTPKEIAEAYPITVDAVYQAVRRGSIPHRRSGGAILIRRADAEQRWGA